MKLLLGLCSVLVGIAASVIPSSQQLGPVFNCSTSDQDEACHIEGLTWDSTAPPDGPSFPEVPLLHLDNCTFDYFSPAMAAKLHSSTESLFILDGFAPKVYLKPTLKYFTDLRADTAEIVIDPVDNYQLELFDIEGHLRSIPDNVRRLKHLVTLDLCENRLERLDLAEQLEGLNRLRKLNLGHNQIRSVISAGEVELPALEELFLHDNRLETLDLTFLKADRLARLYLSQNQLVTVGGFPERFPQLRRVDLYGNPWDCEWLERTLGVLKTAGVETLNYLPDKVCDEKGSVKVDGISCEKKSNAS